MKTFLTIILLSTSFLCWSQPSFTVSIQFQLKDEQGILSFERLCSEYQIRESFRATDLGPCDLTKKYRSGYYIDSIQSIRIATTIVYNDVSFDIIRDSDTMHMYCPTWVAMQRNFNLGIDNQSEIQLIFDFEIGGHCQCGCYGRGSTGSTTAPHDGPERDGNHAA